ncbi:hypothetical protein [Streptomyces sp. NPDC018693]|uniref:hypothetical protein n=1 Tax=unclassified Streptomyces TaxID=2593676 RepID=UPI00378B4675
MNRHLRKAAVVTAAITAGLLMTACQNDSATSGGSSSTSSSEQGSKGSAAVADKAADKAGEKAGEKAGDRSAGSKGVSGTFSNGTVTYLAPGKYIVSVPGKGDQQFWVADDTEVHGAGTICGDAQSKVDAPCTQDQLETAAKKGAVPADVEMKDGVATRVSERRAKGKGVNGTWFGHVSYLAPGTYTVTEEHGTAQQFFIAEDTRIWGYGQVCGGPGTGEGEQGGTECTEAELESAAKKGFTAEVEITNGVATTLRDTP